MSLTTLPGTTAYVPRCPKCGGGGLRSNSLGELIRIATIDPLTGEIKPGATVEFRPSEAADLYTCSDPACGYENVVPSMFVAKEDE